MRILMLLANRFPPDIRVENEVATLLAAGNEVHLLCKSDNRDEIALPDALRNLIIHTLTPKSERVGWKAPSELSLAVVPRPPLGARDSADR